MANERLRLSSTGNPGGGTIWSRPSCPGSSFRACSSGTVSTLQVNTNCHEAVLQTVMLLLRSKY
ncbi:hypothetical protein E2C01_054941 [Portunus trituberculatus]|uniref:Uncharacterized protein n=1 Tax=Portunus trituberculatus TaxID=210409 RepID=A0A5B7GPX6_PORTR|nr:hypothetical protein [Portunus trituberculatus]